MWHARRHGTAPDNEIYLECLREGHVLALRECDQVLHLALPVKMTAALTVAKAIALVTRNRRTSLNIVIRPRMKTK